MVGLLGGVPNEDDTIHTRGRVSAGELLDAVDGILVLGGELGFGGCFSSVDLVLEHLHGRGLLVSSSGSSSASSVQLLDQLPSSLVLEENRAAVVSDSNNSGWVNVEEVQEGQVLGLHFSNSGLSVASNVSNIEGRIVSNVAELVSRGRPLDRLNPSTAFNLKVGFSEGQLISPRSVRNSLVDSLNVSSEHSDLKVTGSGGEKSVVWMPVNLQDSGLVLLDVLGDPPVIVLFEVADRDAFGSATNSEFVLFRRPLHVGGSTVDTKNDKSGLPLIVLECPDISITILRASNNTIGLRSPVNSSDNLVMLSQFGFQSVFTTSTRVNVDFVVVGAESNFGLVAVKSETGNTRC